MCPRAQLSSNSPHTTLDLHICSTILYLPVPKATIFPHVTALQPHHRGHLSPMLVAGRGGMPWLQWQWCQCWGRRGIPAHPHTLAAGELALLAVGWGSCFLWSAHKSSVLPQLPSPDRRDYESLTTSRGQMVRASPCFLEGLFPAQEVVAHEREPDRSEEAWFLLPAHHN